MNYLKCVVVIYIYLMKWIEYNCHWNNWIDDKLLRN